MTDLDIATNYLKNIGFSIVKSYGVRGSDSIYIKFYRPHIKIIIENGKEVITTNNKSEIILETSYLDGIIINTFIYDDIKGDIEENFHSYMKSKKRDKLIGGILD